MDVQRINEEIERLEVEVSKHEKEAETYRQEAQRIAGSLDHYNEKDVREAQSLASKHAQRVDSIRTRISALQAQLPTKDEVKKTQKQFKELLARKEDAEAKLHDIWSSFEDALEAAEQIGRQIVEARTTMQKSQAQLEDLKREFGFDDPLPVLSMPDYKLAWLLGVWLSEMTCGEPGASVERDLAAERARETVPQFALNHLLDP